MPQYIFSSAWDGEKIDNSLSKLLAVEDNGTKRLIIKAKYDGICSLSSRKFKMDSKIFYDITTKKVELIFEFKPDVFLLDYGETLETGRQKQFNGFQNLLKDIFNTFVTDEHRKANRDLYFGTWEDAQERISELYDNLREGYADTDNDDEYLHLNFLDYDNLFKKVAEAITIINFS